MATSGESGVIPIKDIGEIMKGLVEVIKPTVEGEKSTPSRAGPLVTVGRLYVSLTFILAAVTSASAFLDEKAAPSCSVEALRVGVLAVIVFGLGLGVLLVTHLVRRHPYLLFSPTELSENAQREIFSPKSKEETESREAPPPPKKQP